ncbi:unnamed protein product [Scytosiphon promiscuus]
MFFADYVLEPRTSWDPPQPPRRGGSAERGTGRKGRPSGAAGTALPLPSPRGLLSQSLQRRGHGNSDEEGRVDPSPSVLHSSAALVSRDGGVGGEEARAASAAQAIGAGSSSSSKTDWQVRRESMRDFFTPVDLASAASLPPPTQLALPRYPWPAKLVADAGVQPLPPTVASGESPGNVWRSKAVALASSEGDGSNTRSEEGAEAGSPRKGMRPVLTSERSSSSSGSGGGGGGGPEASKDEECGKGSPGLGAPGTLPRHRKRGSNAMANRTTRST